MTEWRKTERRFFPPFANERVIIGALANRRLQMRQVWKVQEQISLLFVRSCDHRVLLRDLFSDCANTCFQIGAGLIMGTQYPDLLAQSISFSIELLQLGLGGPALSVDSKDFVDLSRQIFAPGR